MAPAGMAYAGSTLLLVLVLAHSAVVQFNTWRGKTAMKDLASVAARGSKIDQAELRSGIAHYERALAWGIISPIDRRKELANLYLLT